jgi:hypothetical protein
MVTAFLAMLYLVPVFAFWGLLTFIVERIENANERGLQITHKHNRE